MKRKIIVLFLAVFVLLTVGCAKIKPGNETEFADEMETIQAAYPLTLIDQTGREVIIEKEPESIISGYYISTSTLISLGQENKLVGIENNADKRPVYAYSSPEILELPSLGSVMEFDLEECAMLNPDLVVIPTKLNGIIPTLEELGITVFVVNPESEELLEEMILLLGKATGSEEKAKEILLYKAEKLGEFQGNKNKPRIYFAGNSSLLTTAGPLMYQNSLIQNAGGKNVAAEVMDTYWAEVSYEQVLAWNPEYIILAADAAYTVEDVLADTNLSECDAVKNKHEYKLPNTIECWDSPVPGSVLGVSWLASILHPQQYEIKQHEDTVIEFYERFYGVTPILE